MLEGKEPCFTARISKLESSAWVHVFNILILRIFFNINKAAQSNWNLNHPS